MSTQLDTLNKRLLVALGLSGDSAQIVIDHIAELHGAAGSLRTEVVTLKQDLKDAGLGRCTCSDCKKTVGNAWRDSDGHHCLSCVAKQRDESRAALETMRAGYVGQNDKGERVFKAETLVLLDAARKIPPCQL